METKIYSDWAITKDRTEDQYNEFGVRVCFDIRQQRVLHAAMGISGESGELMDAIKKHVMYNKTLDVENVKEELGDICWYMALMLDAIGSDFDEVMLMNRDKLEKRYPTGFTEQAAQERKDKQ